MNKVVGRVSETERDEIQALFERRNGLNELAKVLTPDSTELYEKLVQDLGRTGSDFQNWWSRMAEKYSWESDENGHWEIDFNTCMVSLIIPS